MMNIAQSQTNNRVVINKSGITPDHPEHDSGESIRPLSTEGVNPHPEEPWLSKRQTEPTGPEATGIRSRKPGIHSSGQPYVCGATHACLQTVGRGRLDPQLKACLLRYVATRFLNQPVPPEDYKTLLNYFHRPLPGMDISGLDTEYIERLCQHGFRLNEIAANRRTKKLCLISCSFDGRNLEHVPFDLRDSIVCEAACRRFPYAISHVPEKILSAWQSSGFLATLCSMERNFIDYIPKPYISYPIIEAACKNGTLAYRQLAKDHPKRDELLKIAFAHNPHALRDFPVAMKTQAVCRSACERDGKCLKYVPEQYRTFSLFHIACHTSSNSIEYLPPDFSDEERDQIYFTACANSANALNYISETYLTYELFKQACLNPSIAYNFTHRPKHLSNEQVTELYTLAFKSSNGKILERLDPAMIEDYHLYDHTCKLLEDVIKNEPMAYFDIPDRFRTSHLFKVALESKPSPEFVNKIDDIESLSKLPYVPIINQFRILTNPKKSFGEKLRLIELIDATDRQPLTLLSTKSLVTQSSPLHCRIKNPFLMDLITVAYQSVDFEPANLKKGEQIDHYAKTNITDFPITDIPEQLLARNSQYQEIAGGRTIQFRVVNKEENSLYFKFQREGEPLQDLAREGLLYQYLHHNPEIKTQFKSTLPSLHGFMKIPLNEHLTATIQTFPDPVAISEENGQPFVHVFSYTAPADYSKYAYVADDNADNPCKKPEQGIFDTLFDVGKLLSMGLILTNMLPAFHDTGSCRRWVALHNAFNLRNGVHPGTLGAWNTDATSKPDFGHSGIRDIGDYEFFGALWSYFQQKDAQHFIHTWPVTQRLALANAIVENILAAVLLRSRLRQLFEDFHYQNPEAVTETARFIESACNELLAGLGASTSSLEQPDNLLKEMLQCPDVDYQQWLQRAAQEVVYWTALQPGETQYEQFPQGRFDHSQCYLNHIAQGKLSPELYPGAEATTKTKEDFHNINGRLNLGANNTTFPLISLMNGLTRMVTGVLMVDDQRTH